MDNNYIIITLYIHANKNTLDIEVPNNISVKKLVHTIVKSLNLELKNYKLKSSFTEIHMDKSLAEAGVWEGEELELI